MHAEQLPALHTVAQAVPVFCQVPVVSHVCGCSPLHCIEPGEQTPAQLPSLHVLVHGVPDCQVPVMSHVCGVSPLHCLAPGVQLPVQPPSMQTYGQAGVQPPESLASETAPLPDPDSGPLPDPDSGPLLDPESDPLLDRESDPLLDPELSPVVESLGKLSPLSARSGTSGSPTRAAQAETTTGAVTSGTKRKTFTRIQSSPLCSPAPAGPYARSAGASPDPPWRWQVMKSRSGLTTAGILGW